MYDGISHTCEIIIYDLPASYMSLDVKINVL